MYKHIGTLISIDENQSKDTAALQTKSKQFFPVKL